MDASLAEDETTTTILLGKKGIEELVMVASDVYDPHSGRQTKYLVDADEVLLGFSSHSQELLYPPYIEDIPHQVQVLAIQPLEEPVNGPCLRLFRT